MPILEERRTIIVEMESMNTCAASLYAYRLKIQRILRPRKNTVEMATRPIARHTYIPYTLRYLCINFMKMLRHGI